MRLKVGLSIFLIKNTRVPVNILKVIGGDLEEDWGTVPPKFEVGDGPCIRSPIFGEVVLSDA